MAVAASAGVALATGLVSTETGSTIDACVNNTNGLVRIVADAASCRTGETPTSWNSTGSGNPGPGAYALVYQGALDPDRTTASVSGFTTHNNDFTNSVRYGCFDLSFVPKNAVVNGVLFPPNTYVVATPAVVLAGMPNYPRGICLDGTDALMQVAVSSMPGDTAPDPPRGASGGNGRRCVLAMHQSSRLGGMTLLP